MGFIVNLEHLEIRFVYVWSWPLFYCRVYLFGVDIALAYGISKLKRVAARNDDRADIKRTNSYSKIS